MSTLLQSEVPPASARKLTIEPGVPLYGVKIENREAIGIMIAVDYDRQDGLLRIVICEARH